jgi:hypothetical protein
MVFRIGIIWPSGEKIIGKEAVRETWEQDDQCQNMELLCLVFRDIYTRKCGYRVLVVRTSVSRDAIA